MQDNRISILVATMLTVGCGGDEIPPATSIESTGATPTTSDTGPAIDDLITIAADAAGPAGSAEPRDVGVEIVALPFAQWGGRTAEHVVVKPARATVLPIVLIDEYDPASDANFAYSVRCVDDGPAYRCTVESRRTADASSFLRGRIALVGLDADMPGFPGSLPADRVLEVGATTVKDGTTRDVFWPGKTRVVPLLAVASYSPNGADHFAWSIECAAQAGGYRCSTSAWGGNSASHVTVRGVLVELP
jgi:hypothetical protein